MNIVAAKDKQIIIPCQLRMHSNHMGIEKMRLLTCESGYWINMNSYIENAKKALFKLSGIH